MTIHGSNEPWAATNVTVDSIVVTTRATTGERNHEPTLCTRPPRNAISSPAACSGVVSTLTTTRPTHCSERGGPPGRRAPRWRRGTRPTAGVTTAAHRSSHPHRRRRATDSTRRGLRRWPAHSPRNVAGISAARTRLPYRAAPRVGAELLDRVGHEPGHGERSRSGRRRAGATSAPPPARRGAGATSGGGGRASGARRDGAPPRMPRPPPARPLLLPLLAVPRPPTRDLDEGVDHGMRCPAGQHAHLRLEQVRTKKGCEEREDLDRHPARWPRRPIRAAGGRPLGVGGGREVPVQRQPDAVEGSGTGATIVGDARGHPHHVSTSGPSTSALACVRLQPEGRLGWSRPVAARGAMRTVMAHSSVRRGTRREPAGRPPCRSRAAPRSTRGPRLGPRMGRNRAVAHRDITGSAARDAERAVLP